MASCERVSTDMMAFPPCPAGLVPKTPPHVDSEMATCFSLRTPYVSSKYANVCATCVAVRRFLLILNEF
jgi:hypothetical protein